MNLRNNLAMNYLTMRLLFSFIFFRAIRKTMSKIRYKCPPPTREKKGLKKSPQGNQKNFQINETLKPNKDTFSNLYTIADSKKALPDLFSKI